MDISITGSLAEPDAVEKLIQTIFSRMNELLPDLSQKYIEEFVKNALTVSGPNSLGQVTGNLARSFTVDDVPVGFTPLDSINAFVPPGDTFDYALAQDEKKDWFNQGVQSSEEFLLNQLSKLIEEAVREVSR